MRPARMPWLLLALLLVLLAVEARAQSTPLPVASPAVVPPDTLRPASRVVLPDTIRQTVIVSPDAELPETVTSRSAWLISATIVVLTLTTLLLYNVRSR
jgi:hypothetical protein